MSKPVVAQKGPYKVQLSPGTFWWCCCGRSSNQPFCDGSHKDTGLSPMKVEISETGTYALCGCKYSGNIPFCDGSHRNLQEDD